MTNSTLAALLLTSQDLPYWQDLDEIMHLFQDDIRCVLMRFLTEPITPAAAYQLEHELSQAFHQMGRQLLETIYNRIEPETQEQAPARIIVDKETYRRKGKSNNQVATRFGEIALRRFLYEPLEAGEKSIFPLEISLGIVARNATPALAEVVGRLAVDHTQSRLREVLREEFHVHWSDDTLRKVTHAFHDQMLPHQHAAQVEQIQKWLRQAANQRGSGQVILAAGRDGIHLPIAGASSYKQGSTATVTVLDRQGRRLGTVYLGQMPQSKQTALSQRLTALIQATLTAWDGPPLRLVYVTDAGSAETEYYQQTLCRMPDPKRPGHYLTWQRIVDFYHASEYVHDLSKVLFGSRERAAQAWARKMCQWLKHKPRGVFRVLHSAAKLRHDGELSDDAEEDYQSAYGYLRRQMDWMDYAEYRRANLPIGSGVTEAACKTLFSQRLKLSGMSWKNPGGQAIVDLRSMTLSGVWKQVHQRALAAQGVDDLYSNYATQYDLYEIVA